MSMGSIGQRQRERKRRVRFREEASLTTADLSARTPQADRLQGLRQMFGKTAPFIIALMWNLFELLLHFVSHTSEAEEEETENFNDIVSTNT